MQFYFENKNLMNLAKDNDDIMCFSFPIQIT